jgi:hypothetical protein
MILRKGRHSLLLICKCGQSLMEGLVMLAEIRKSALPDLNL